MITNGIFKSCFRRHLFCVTKPRNPFFRHGVYYYFICRLPQSATTNNKTTIEHNTKPQQATIYHSLRNKNQPLSTPATVILDMPSSEGSSSNTTNNSSKPQPPSFAHLHPPTASRQQGLGIGRESRTSAFDQTSHESTSTSKKAKKGSGKFFTDCKQEYLASINCRLEHYDHKESGACQKFFNTYKDCRKEENERRLAENAAGGSLF